MEIEINRIDASLRKRLILQLLGSRSTAILAIKWTLCCVPKPFSDRARASHLRLAPFTRQRFRLLSIRNIPGDTRGSADEFVLFPSDSSSFSSWGHVRGRRQICWGWIENAPKI
jgi:hypothetical protein